MAKYIGSVEPCPDCGGRHTMEIEAPDANIAMFELKLTALMEYGPQIAAMEQIGAVKLAVVESLGTVATN